MSGQFVSSYRNSTKKKNNQGTRTLILSSEVPVTPRRLQGGPGEHQLEKLRKRKRRFDLFLCILSLPVIMLVFPLIALIIKCSSKGPVLFKQKRQGKNGKLFTCYKFRTMHIKSKEGGGTDKPNVTKKNDSRVYALGLYLRKNNLDELPQLFNVIRGDMSLIGPRPYMISECEYWKDEMDNFKMREKVKPGISGLAQVNGYRGGNLDKRHMKTRLSYDLLYIKSYNLKIDFLILWKTLLPMITLNTNAY